MGVVRQLCHEPAVLETECELCLMMVTFASDSTQVPTILEYYFKIKIFLIGTTVQYLFSFSPLYLLLLELDLHLGMMSKEQLFLWYIYRLYIIRQSAIRFNQRKYGRLSQVPYSTLPVCSISLICL